MPAALCAVTAQHIGHELRGFVAQRDQGPEQGCRHGAVCARHRRGQHLPVPPRAGRRSDLADRLGLFRLPHTRRPFRPGALCGTSPLASGQDDRAETVARGQTWPRRRFAQSQSQPRNRRSAGRAHGAGLCVARPAFGVQHTAGVAGFCGAAARTLGWQTRGHQAVCRASGRMVFAGQGHAGDRANTRFHRRGWLRRRHGCRTHRVFRPCGHAFARRPAAGAQQPGGCRPARPHQDRGIGQGDFGLRHGTLPGPGGGLVQRGAGLHVCAGLHPVTQLPHRPLPHGRGHSRPGAPTCHRGHRQGRAGVLLSRQHPACPGRSGGRCGSAKARRHHAAPPDGAQWPRPGPDSGLQHRHLVAGAAAGVCGPRATAQSLCRVLDGQRGRALGRAAAQKP